MCSALTINIDVNSKEFRKKLERLVKYQIRKHNKTIKNKFEKQIEIEQTHEIIQGEMFELAILEALSLNHNYFNEIQRGLEISPTTLSRKLKILIKKKEIAHNIKKGEYSIRILGINRLIENDMI